MTTQNAPRQCLLLALICSGWLSSRPAVSAVPPGGSTAAGGTTNGAVTVKRLNGTFTVSAFEVNNGRSEAIGLLTAKAIDATGRPVNLFTNALVKLPIPLNGALAGKADLLDRL